MAIEWNPKSESAIHAVKLNEMNGEKELKGINKNYDTFKSRYQMSNK